MRILVEVGKTNLRLVQQSQTNFISGPLTEFKFVWDVWGGNNHGDPNSMKKTSCKKRVETWVVSAKV